VQNIPKARKSFWLHPMVLLADEARVEAHFGPFGGSAKLTQNRCKVYAKRTIGSKIILDASDGTLTLCGSWQILFRSV
jgi:hypothetical protein